MMAYPLCVSVEIRYVSENTQTMTHMSMRPVACALLLASAHALHTNHPRADLSRRSMLPALVAPAGAVVVGLRPATAATELKFTEDPATGLSWADSKVGTGAPLQKGQQVAIDYVMSTTGAR